MTADAATASGVNRAIARRVTSAPDATPTTARCSTPPSHTQTTARCNTSTITWVVAPLMSHIGWRAAYAALGSGCAVVTLASALTVRLPRPEETPGLLRRHAAPGAPVVHAPGVTLWAALADPRQWCLNVAWLLLGGVALMVSVHVVPPTGATCCTSNAIEVCVIG